MEELDLQIDRKERDNRWIATLLCVLIVFLVVLIIFFNFATLCKVKGRSMEDTLCDKQYVMLLNGKKAKRNDIIVFKTDETDYYLIKRVIGVAGDKLLFASGDGENVEIYRLSGGFNLLNEDSYIKEKIKFPPGGVLSRGKLDIVIYRYSEFDGGEAEDFVITVPKSSYFVLGDNRNHSDDSRTYGYISKNDVEGRMLFKISRGSFLEKFFTLIYREKQTE